MAKRLNFDIDATLNIIITGTGLVMQREKPGDAGFSSFRLTFPEYTLFTRAIDEHRQTLTNAVAPGVVIEEDT